MTFLSEEMLAAMAFDHKYSSSGCSVLDGLIMQKFWNWIINFFPLKHDANALFHWSAPNTMTLGGLFCMFLPTITLLCYCYDFESTAPSWVYLMNACGIFIYQTLDALDGKQARRTGSSSSFGELFDHGCDAVSTILGSCSSLVALQLGKTEIGFAVFMGSLLAFSGCHIQTYYKGCLTFGFFDVTEIQFMGMGLMLISAVAEGNFWDTLVLGVPIRMVPAVFVPLASVLAILGNIYVSLTVTPVPYASSRQAELWSGAFLLAAIASVWFVGAKDEMSGTDYGCFLFALGFLNATHACALIVAHMSRCAVGRLVFLRFIPTVACAAASLLGIVPGILWHVSEILAHQSEIT